MNRKLVNSELDKYRKRGKGTYTYCGVGCDCNIAVNLLEENQQLKKQLEYLRSGEYLNQLKFERNLLEDIVQDKELSNEVYSMKEMMKANTKLCERVDLCESVLKEIREYINQKLTDVNLRYGVDNEFREEYDDLLQILDKGNK